MTIEQAAETLKYSCNILSQCDDLSPANDTVNKILSNMIRQVCKWQACGYGKCLLAQKDLNAVRGALPPLCARAEDAMERHWAQYFIACGKLTENDLHKFWYFDNYLNVVETEIDLMQKHLGHIRGISFIGAGPLPMTVLIAAFKLPNVQFECVDCDAEACAMAQGLIDALGLSERIRVVQARGEDYLPPAGFVPFIASLVEDKPALYHAYQQAGIEAFLVRDAEDIYQFIYHAAARPDEILWRESGKTALCTSRLNTTRIYQLNNIQKELFCAA